MYLNENFASVGMKASGFLGTLAHHGKFLKFTQAKLIISDHAIVGGLKIE